MSETQESSPLPGENVDQGEGRIFPCEECGADLEFHIGNQDLTCPFCGHRKVLEIADDAEIREQDFHAMLDALRDKRVEKVSTPAEGEERHEVRCAACGANVSFEGSLTSTACAYCATPLQRDRIKVAEDRIPVDGVLPFKVDRKKAKGRLEDWIKSRWFAPNRFLNSEVRDKITGVYQPFWTFDTLTWNRYRGERGDHYYVTVGSGDQKRQERRTRWTRVSGDFQRFFDDVLVLAATGLPRKVMAKLEPWPLAACVPDNQQVMAGYLARTYDVELDDGFTEARGRIDSAIRAHVRRLIGGDEQRIHGIDSRYDAITYKHLLLPVWMLAHKFDGKVYNLIVNAGTGEVQGERPWSAAKIAALAAAVIAVVATIVLLSR